MLKKLNIPALIVLIIYPALLIGLGINYFSNYSVGWTEALIAIAGYYGSNIAVGVGLHRAYSHHAFKVSKPLELILVFMTAGTLQGPILAWASDHNLHHTYTDKERDPHSPLKSKNKFLGFLWSHIGWMLVHEDYKTIDRVTMVKLGRNENLKWQLKYYWELAIFMSTIVPAILGFIVYGTLFGAYTGFLFIGLGRALQQQATFCVNSMCHFIGRKKYYHGTAGDIWWMALFLLGENWHNFHHAFPSDYRNGHKWYHFDVHKWIIYGLYKLGLASDLESTAEVRISAKMKDTLEAFANDRKEELSALQNKANQLSDHIAKKFDELEASSVNLKQQVGKSFLDMQEYLRKLGEQIQKASEHPSSGIIKMVKAKLRDAEIKVSELSSSLGYSPRA